MDAKEILKQHIAKTATLTEEQFDYFFSHFKPKSYKKGQVVISEGQQVEHEYFVISGCLKAFFINDEIKMYILQFAMPAPWIEPGILEALPECSFSEFTCCVYRKLR